MHTHPPFNNELQSETSPLMQTSTSMGPTCWPTRLSQLKTPIWYGVVAAGCYLSFMGAVGAMRLFTQSDIVYLIGAISAGSNFAILSQAKFDCEMFKKELLPCLFFGIAYSFTSAVLTFKQAPTKAQQWAFGIFNGITNLPFSFENTHAMFENVSDFKAQWKTLNIKQKGILFCNLAIVFLIVICCLIGFAAPIIQLIVGLIGQNLLQLYVAGLLAPILNCIELFFQMNEMIYFKDGPNSRQLFGYVKNPFPDDAFNHKMTSAISLLLSFIQSLSFGGFTYSVLLPEHEIVAISLGIISLIAPTWSGIKPAYKLINKLASPAGTGANYLTAGLAWIGKGVFNCIPECVKNSMRPKEQTGYESMV